MLACSYCGCWKAWCCQRTRGYTKELQDLCHEWEVESMHNLSIQTPLGLLDFLVLPRGTLMICRQGDLKSCLSIESKNSPFCFFLHPFHSWFIFQHVLLLFVMPFTVPVLHFLTLQGTNKYPLPRHFWRWCSFCHSFPQVCASSPGGSIFVCFVDRFPRATATPLYGLGFSPCAITHRSRRCIGCPGSPVHFFGDGKCHWIH